MQLNVQQNNKKKESCKLFFSSTRSHLVRPPGNEDETNTASSMRGDGGESDEKRVFCL